MSAADLPRVLVVAHNPFSDSQNNGKTLSAFFRGWPTEKLAQVYLTLDEPSFTVCRRFFRLTDLDVLKTLARRPTPAAGPVSETAWAADAQVKAGLGRRRGYRAVRKVFLARPPSAMLARSVAWRLALRRHDSLDRWIDDVDPEVVFFQSSSATFAFDLVADVCDRRGIPLVLSTTDDYVTPPPGRTTPVARWHYRSMQQRYLAAVRRSHVGLAIGRQMAEEYERRFGGRWEVAMNSVDLEPVAPPRDLSSSGPLRLLFAGNLGLERWRVLAAVGAALDDLSERTGTEAVLHIWSLDPPEGPARTALEASSRVRFRGAADADTLRRERTDADLLVHVESFDEHNRHITRLSVSTKIPEYLATGRVLLCVGPPDVASIAYVRDHDAGVVVTDPSAERIADALLDLVRDPARAERLRGRARALAEANHSQERTRRLVQQEMRDAAASHGPARQ